MIGTITVNPSIDQHVAIDALVKDDAIHAREIRRDPGGKGINVSRALRVLGGDTVAYGITGGCAGYMLKSRMADLGIRLECMEVTGETRINVIVTDRSDRTQTRISVPGPWMTLEETERFVAFVTRCEPFPQWWVLGGTLPPGVPRDLYARLITALQRRGARCVLDADDEALKIGLQARPSLIKPNEHEFARLTGEPVDDEAAVLGAAAEVARRGVGIVAVTLGARGALLVTADEALRAVCPPVEVRSKVGAGDAFVAGCVLALARGEALAPALRLGVAAGTAAVMSEGTELCRAEDVRLLLDRITVERAELPPAAPRARTATMRDPVCGMAVDPELAAFDAIHRGRDYRFCSLRCLQAFEKGPERFVRTVERR